MSDFSWSQASVSLYFAGEARLDIDWISVWKLISAICERVYKDTVSCLRCPSCNSNVRDFT